MFYRKSTLRNGVTVISDAMPGVRSVSLGIWCNVGSRDERPEQSGLTHFMEHMMFKGTPTRTAFDISTAFDALGAESNAFTSKEYTCYYARCVDEKLPAALEILADMVLNSSFADAEIEPEREVVLEEIARAQDTPDDCIFDVFADAFWPEHPLGRAVLGDAAIVGAYQHDNLAEFHAQHYFSGNICVAAAGNVDHDDLSALCERVFSGMPEGEKERRGALPTGQAKPFAAQRKDTEQAHIVYGVPYLAQDDPRRFAGSTMTAMLGGSMSSRLFQEVREKRGLVYSIYASPSVYQGLGAWSVYAGTRPENIRQVVAIVRRELARLAQDGTDAEELSRTKESICGSILLSTESTSGRMMRVGRAATLGSELLSPDEMVERYRAVTCEEVQRMAQEFLLATPTIAVVSPYEADAVREMVEDEDTQR